MRISRTFGETNITSMTPTWTATDAASGAARNIETFLDGTEVDFPALNAGPHSTPFSQEVTDTLPASLTGMDVYLSTNHSSSETVLIAMRVTGTGDCPFGVPNC
jgi:hypothetical protein